MKSLKSKMIIALIIMLCVSLICGVLTFFVTNVDNANAQNFSYTGTLKQKYNLNQTVTIPSAKIGDVDATYVVALPDGSFTKAKTIDLSLPGLYSIEYQATIDGVVYNDIKTFLVNNSLFTINGVGSYEFVGYDNPHGETSGLLFNVKNGDSIVYNDVVDLKAINGAKSTIFRLSMNTETPGEAEISQYEVLIEDAYDPSIYIRVRVKQPPGAATNRTTHAYMDATFNELTYCGMNKSTSGKYTVSNLQGMEPATNTFSAYLNEEKWGAALTYSFTGGSATSPNNTGYMWGGLAFDVNTNVLYGMTGRGDSTLYRIVVADLNNADIFGEKFPGFTDGKVKVTITPTAFVKGSANLFISHMGDAQITERSSNEFLSPYEPKITVNYGDYTKETIPQVKRGNSYKLFSATAYDIIDGDLPITTKVYYNYYSNKRVQCEIKNGAFMANRVGPYTIVYSTINSNGKTDTVLVDVESIANANKLDINLTNELNYSQPVLAGSSVKIFDDFELINQVGNIIYSFTATHKTQPNITFNLTLDNDYSFVPTVKGEYEVVYTVSDYSETQIYTKTLTVNESDNIYYELSSNFPNYLIKNGSYKIDFISAYTLDTGVPVKQDIKIAVDVDGVLTDYSNNLLTITDGSNGNFNLINSNNKVKIVVYPNVNGITSDDYFVKEIPVIDTGLYTEESLDMTKYFVVDKGNVNFYGQEVGIDAVVNNFDDGLAKFSWINTLSTKPFKIEIEPIVKSEGYNRFDELNVYLYDFNDVRKFVKLSFFYDGAWYTTLNNNQKVYKVANTWGTADDQLSFSLNAFKHKLVTNRSFTWENITYYGTDELVDYSNGCLMSVEIKGQDGCDGVKIVSINDSQVSNIGVDLAPTYIETLHDNNAGEKSLNEIITTSIFKNFDLITPYLQTTITVQVRPDGAKKYSNVTALDGTLLSAVPADKVYQFKLEEYGSYKVTIEVYDNINYNNDVPFTYQIIVVDDTLPEVVINSASTTASVGSKLSIPKFTVTNKEDYSWYIAVKEPNGIMHYVSDELPYSFTKAGKYEVNLLVYDSNYNTTCVTYTVIVK